MRADAHRNRERILEAAIEVFLEAGIDAPLDAIARRAEVGIGTLYRRFPDREALINAVGLHVLELSIRSASTAMEREPDSFAALHAYMHDAIDQGFGVLNLLYSKVTDSRWEGRRAESARLIQTIIERAKHEGRLRSDVRIPDIGFGIIRFSRPVAPGLSLSEERLVAHRHLAIYVDGMSADTGRAEPLPAPDAMDRFDPAGGNHQRRTDRRR